MCALFGIFLHRKLIKGAINSDFQVASCTLDAGAKIYAGRVDSVHADAYKMLGSLGRATEMPSGEGKQNEFDPVLRDTN